MKGWDRVMKGYLLIGVAIAALVYAGCGVKSNPEAEQAASDASEAWLDLVDRGDYGGSWEAAADYLKVAVTKENWLQSMRGHRGPLGEIVSRELASQRYVTILPGAPDGEYVIVQYK